MPCIYLLTLQFLQQKVLMHFLSLNHIETMEMLKISKLMLSTSLKKRWEGQTSENSGRSLWEHLKFVENHLLKSLNQIETMEIKRISINIENPKFGATATKDSHLKPRNQDNPRQDKKFPSFLNQDKTRRTGLTPRQDKTKTCPVLVFPRQSLSCLGFSKTETVLFGLFLVLDPRQNDSISFINMFWHWRKNVTFSTSRR